MRKRVSTVLIVAVAIGIAIGIGTWLTLNLRAKQKYDKARDELAKGLPSVVKMDSDTMAFVADVRANWVESYSEVRGVHSDALKTLGLRPTVKNLVHVFTHRLPEYTFLSPEQNLKSMVMGIVQGTIVPMTNDQSIHLSDDGHLALVRCHTNIVLMFSDEPTGLREAMYKVKQKNIEPGAEGGAVNRAP